MCMRVSVRAFARVINPFPPLAAGGSAVGGRPGGHTAHSGQHGQETAQRLSVHLQTGRRLQPQPHAGYTLQHPTCYTLDARASHDARLQRGRSFIALSGCPCYICVYSPIKMPQNKTDWGHFNSFCCLTSISLSLSLCLSLYVYLPLCLSVSVCISLPLCLPLSLSLSLSLCVCLCVCRSLCVSVSPSVCLSLPLAISLSVYTYGRQCCHFRLISQSDWALFTVQFNSIQLKKL